jgi:hypothetical protein
MVPRAARPQAAQVQSPCAASRRPGARTPGAVYLQPPPTRRLTPRASPARRSQQVPRRFSVLDGDRACVCACVERAASSPQHAPDGRRMDRIGTRYVCLRLAISEPLARAALLFLQCSYRAAAPPLARPPLALHCACRGADVSPEGRTREHQWPHAPFAAPIEPNSAHRSTGISRLGDVETIYCCDDCYALKEAHVRLERLARALERVRGGEAKEIWERVTSLAAKQHGC